MKTINNFRPNHSFKISSVHVHHLAKISERFGRELVSVAHHKSEHDHLGKYTVRVINEHSDVIDHVIEIYSDVRILETKVVIRQPR